MLKGEVVVLVWIVVVNLQLSFDKVVAKLAK